MGAKEWMCMDTIRSLWGWLALATLALAVRCEAADVCGMDGAGDLEAVKRWVEKDPKWVRERKEAGQATPLHYAAQNGWKEVVEYLLAKGAEVDAREE